MTIDDIKHIIAPDEHRGLELKKTTGELKDAMHSACAFLNTDGGWLIFGIAPISLKIIGEQVTDNTQREIARALSYLEPQVDIRVEYVEVPDRLDQKVIAMFFDGWVWGKQPYTYHKCPYYRVESTTREMPREMFEERLRAAKPQYYAWERQKADGISISDLYEERIPELLGDSDGTAKDNNPESINGILNDTPFRVSYRVQNELVLYLSVLIENAGFPEDIESCISEAVLAILLEKVLPRVQGEKKQLESNGGKSNILKDMKVFVENRFKPEVGEGEEIANDSLYMKVIKKLEEMDGKLSGYYTNFF